MRGARSRQRILRLERVALPRWAPDALALQPRGDGIVLERVRAVDGLVALYVIGGHVLPVVADLGDPATPALVVEKAVAEFGRLDVVVNNAAVIATGPLHSFTRADFDRHYAVNVAGPFFLVAAALPFLRSANDAVVVNISSSVGPIVKPGTIL